MEEKADFKIENSEKSSKSKKEQKKGISTKSKVIKKSCSPNLKKEQKSKKREGKGIAQREGKIKKPHKKKPLNSHKKIKENESNGIVNSLTKGETKDATTQSNVVEKIIDSATVLKPDPVIQLPKNEKCLKEDTKVNKEMPILKTANFNENFYEMNIQEIDDILGLPQDYVIKEMHDHDDHSIDKNKVVLESFYYCSSSNSNNIDFSSLFENEINQSKEKKIGFGNEMYEEKNSSTDDNEYKYLQKHHSEKDLESLELDIFDNENDFKLLKENEYCKFSFMKENFQMDDAEMPEILI